LKVDDDCKAEGGLYILASRCHTTRNLNQHQQPGAAPPRAAATGAPSAAGGAVGEATGAGAGVINRCGQVSIHRGGCSTCSGSRARISWAGSKQKDYCLHQFGHTRTKVQTPCCKYTTICTTHLNIHREPHSVNLQPRQSFLRSQMLVLVRLQLKYKHLAPRLLPRALLQAKTPVLVRVNM
jgi:hypothetical protein